MVLPWMVRSRSPSKTFSPSTPMTTGDVAWPRAWVGHSTNFAKLYRNAALIWYSVGGESCAKHLNPRTKTSPRSRTTALIGAGGFAAFLLFFPAARRFLTDRTPWSPFNARRESQLDFVVCLSNKIAFHDGGFAGHCQVRRAALHLLLAASGKPTTIQFQNDLATIAPDSGCRGHLSRIP